jgi:hypothetical protein
VASQAAVGAVSLTLQALLRDRVDDPGNPGNPVPVTLGAPGPDRDPEGDVEPSRINLFLYQVVENPFLKNQDTVGLGHPDAYGHPPLSLDLHYLLTVYGTAANNENFDETPAHLLLGSAMQVLHDHAILTDAIVTQREPAGLTVLDPTLREEAEQVKLTLRSLGLEDLSNVWLALTLPYRLSVAYEVNVVQIDSQRPRRHPPLVQEPPGGGPNLVVMPLRRPGLSTVAVRPAGQPAGTERAAPFARVGDTLILHGTGLGGGSLTVRLGPIEVAPDEIGPAGDRMEVTVPDDVRPDGSTIAPPDRLQPGTHPVQVTARAPGFARAALASDTGAFVLVPGVDDATVADRTLTVTGSRLLASVLPSQVIVGSTTLGAAALRPGSTDDRVEVTLPDSLPCWPTAALVSGSLAAFPDLSGSFELSLTIGGEGPVTATLATTPTTLPEAAAALQTALRSAAPGPGFRRARVAATGRSLVLVPGDLESAVTVEAGDLADALALRPPAAAAASLLLSGTLRPFRTLTNPLPALDLTIGATTRRVTLDEPPTTLAEAATSLEAGIRAAGGPAFSATRVVVLGDQLGVITGGPDDVAFAPAAGVDETTAGELGLRVDLPVRIRVGGIESLDPVTVRLPA